MKKTLRFFRNLSISFLLSDAMVAFCHVRNPFMGFLESTPTYVLFGCTALSILLWALWKLKEAKRTR